MKEGHDSPFRCVPNSRYEKGIVDRTVKDYENNIKNYINNFKAKSSKSPFIKIVLSCTKDVPRSILLHTFNHTLKLNMTSKDFKIPDENLFSYAWKTKYGVCTVSYHKEVAEYFEKTHPKRYGDLNLIPFHIPEPYGYKAKHLSETATDISFWNIRLPHKNIKDIIPFFQLFANEGDSKLYFLGLG